MAQVEEKIQVKEALDLIEEVFDNLEDLVFNVEEKVRHNPNIPYLYDFIDSLYKVVGTTKSIIEYIMDNIQPQDIYSTLDFYRSWLAYIQRLLYANLKDLNMTENVMGTVTYIIANLYKSFREFKKNNENRQNKVEGIVLNPNTPIPTREL
ncbi:hypothetical protein [Acidianus bottle-shaped virus]|uniref:Uncharacterized protein ORF150a n=1 Tax=Acidianus bottle-shaped virus (isolate Italy/Pozzuoli) TaxID=654911 RepID=Y150A_ABVP|nr:hypothetical protein ABV_gp50 [Acidianus bottle-shaped virus]A4ZUD6.1 RecName: Full=Uncharacterized protein ORF150a [Acidianus bottle-shaped virus (isolate Pozzuoli)]ABP73440.1 hypothetical protein [Acidianus bottle-shaped virus]